MPKTEQEPLRRSLVATYNYAVAMESEGQNDLPTICKEIPIGERCTSSTVRARGTANSILMLPQTGSRKQPLPVSSQH